VAGDSRQAVLLDTTAIIGAHRFGVWKQIANRFRLETVEKCVEEAATGDQTRSGYVAIDTREVRRVVAVHAVSETAFVGPGLVSRCFADLHSGEKELLAHACGRDDMWLLTSQDTDCLKACHELGLLDRTVSLEKLARQAGANARFIVPFTEKWLGETRTKIIQGVL